MSLCDLILVSLGIRKSNGTAKSITQKALTEIERERVAANLSEQLKDIVLGDLEIDEPLIGKLEARFDQIIQ